DQQRLGGHDILGRVQRAEHFLLVATQGRLGVGGADSDLLARQPLVLGAFLVLGQSRGELGACLSVSLPLFLASGRRGCHPGGLRLDRLTGVVLVHGRVQYLQAVPEFSLVDQVVPRGTAANRRAVEHSVFGGG